MSSHNRSVKAATKHHNRVAAIMLHTSRYGCFPTSRLAVDAGVAKSTICKMIHGRAHPLYATTLRVVKCLEQQLGFSLDHREVFSEDGSYPTTFVCDLARCPGLGCRPEITVDREGAPIPALRFIQRGQWTGDNFEFEDKSKQERRP